MKEIFELIPDPIDEKERQDAETIALQHIRKVDEKSKKEALNN